MKPVITLNGVEIYQVSDVVAVSVTVTVIGDSAAVERNGSWKITSEKAA
jgi:hypothetical protein